MAELKRNELINQIAMELASPAFSAEYTDVRDAPGAQSGFKEEKFPIQNFIRKILGKHPKYSKSWELTDEFSESDWYKENALPTTMMIDGLVEGFTNEQINKSNNVETGSIVDDYFTFSKNLNIDPLNIPQTKLLEKSGYPKGYYGKYTAKSNRHEKEWEIKDGRRKNIKNDAVETDLYANLFYDSVDDILSTILPEVKVTAKAHDAIDSKIMANNIRSK